MAEGIFSKFERDELNKITAKSILEKLMNIRQCINVEFTARRLVWELMQNAKDNANLCNDENEKVDVSIVLEENQFTFSHNKGYFTNEHIRGLIRKYSSSDKDRDTEEKGHIYKTTGRFGTGFMTTHLLSEKVQVSSYYKNEKGNYNQFDFSLDRSGKNEKEIIYGINNAFDEAEESIKYSQDLSLNKTDFKTSFTYPLTERKKSLAETALQEVEIGIAYTLINVPEINTVSIDQEFIGTDTYRIDIFENIDYEGNYFIVHNLFKNGRSTKFYFITIQETDLRIIIPVSYQNEKYYAVPLSKDIPRLHLDFPMIGTEDLNLPFIINSPLFEPTEPRDGVSLMGNDNDTSKINCDILLRAVDLYQLFLSYIGNAADWDNLYNLARIKTPKKHNWIDEEWFRENVVIPIRSKLLYTPIVDVVDGNRISILDQDGEHQVFFPYAEKDDVREKIWILSQKLYPQCIPIKSHIGHWNDVIWKDCYKYNIEELTKDIEQKKNLENIASQIGGDENDAIVFLNRYYDLLNLEKNHIKDIAADKYRVVLNQLGELKKRGELFIEKEQIDDELKNVCSFISENPKEYLRHIKIKTASDYPDIDSILRYGQKNNKDIINEINKVLKEGEHQNISKACDYLASLFPNGNDVLRRTNIYEYSQLFYPDDFNEKRMLTYYDEKIWEESDKYSVNYVSDRLASLKSINGAISELFFDNSNAFLKWIDEYISFLIREGFEHHLNRKTAPILANQNGFFCAKDNLFLDAGDIDDELKEISAELGCDFREELLDASVYLVLPENRVYNIESVAKEISSLIKPIIRNVDKRKEFKDTLRKFYLWMDENKSKASKYFSDLYETKFLFLEDDDISSNIKKATELDKIMKEYNIENMDELRTHLSKLQADIPTEEVIGSESEKIFITKEVLASLGISSQEEFEEAFKDPAISSRFFHTSTPSIEMYDYVQGLIQRAKRNIITYLQQHDDYDCEDLEDDTTDTGTIIVGIKKKDIPIQIVARPSDNSEVIFYYSSEKDTLDNDDSELWVENGVTAPHILTLGRILKSTGINRIPIKFD